MKNIVVFDMDGTLSLVGDREKHLLTEPKDWASYFNRCDEDTPNVPILRLFKILNMFNSVYIVTGRRENTRRKTLNWLRQQHISLAAERLLMRKNDDRRHDIFVKPDLVKGFINEIDLVFEDRNSMVAKWRELGITCCQVAEGDF